MKNLLTTLKLLFISIIIVLATHFSYAEKHDKKNDSFFHFLKKDNSKKTTQPKTSIFDFFHFKGTNSNNDNSPNHSFFGFSTGYSNSRDTKPQDQNATIHSVASSPTVSLLIGKYYNDFLKLQLELNHKFTYKSTAQSTQDTESQEFQSSALFFNPVFYFPVASLDNTLQMLLITGIGTSYNKSKDRIAMSPPDTTTQPGKGRFNLAWQIGAGVSAQINKITSVEFLLKYIDRGKISSTKNSNFPSSRTQKLQSMDFSVGLSFDIDKK